MARLRSVAGSNFPLAVELARAGNRRFPDSPDAPERASILVHALAAPSGPWPGPDGMNMAGPPSFTQSLDEALVGGYLKPLKLTHNYHFWGNRPSAPGVYLDVKLKDAKGEILTTLRFPDSTTNAWVRYLQGLFAQGLVPDQP